MRSDWVPYSASALVVGAMSLVFATLLNPSTGGDSTVETLEVASESGFRWLAMSVMFFLASFALTLGLPVILTLFERRGRKLGLTGVALFTLGAIGTCGYAMLLVFFRALVAADALNAHPLEEAAKDTGLVWFLYVWIGGFYGGLLLIAIGLLLAKTTPRWVPIVFIVFVVMLPVSSQLGRVGMAVQTMALAIAFTGVAMAAVSGETQRALRSEPVF
ncbi:MAG: hypothetical protein HOQ22_09590 [Nocardioidaceae bacterium]|nr:hypothetical protein [Nocardioidaceae bacterium]NUS51274.1 hypothetical protein [Nocardioidaceae bacterium]